VDLCNGWSFGAIGGMTGLERPGGGDHAGGSITPSEVSMVNPGRPTLRTTFNTSTPVRIGR
jgi:hypothetical protein